jgi:Bacteriocin-protection, YdeI or OmpD-Associated
MHFVFFSAYFRPLRRVPLSQSAPSVVSFSFFMPIHPTLARELAKSKRLLKFFNSLPDSTREQIDRTIREVKKEETRQRRACHAAEYLMETMEAELDPPPLIRAAFTRNAKACRGWELMPQSLRRQYLIGIFSSRFPETRALYLERTVMESAQYADRNC